MAVRLSIGDFSRMTHLSVKALRHYHDLGLLEPARIDPETGYRSYEAAQVPLAQMIRRFRDLAMPVEGVKAVLAAPDVSLRNALIAAHLERMETQLDQTKSVVASLRMLLAASLDPIAVAYRSVPAVRVASIAASVKLAEIEPWWSGAFAELRSTLQAANVRHAGPPGGIYPTELFTAELAEITLFIPIAGRLEPTGRVRVSELPAAELAVALHEGPLREADRTYAPLGKHVTERAIGVDGPIREHYLVGDDDTTDESLLRTEICWPILRTASTERRE
jgi:DNA-binding transcriptional MerR regulator